MMSAPMRGAHAVVFVLAAFLCGMTVEDHWTRQAAAPSKPAAEGECTDTMYQFQTLPTESHFTCPHSRHRGLLQNWSNRNMLVCRCSRSLVEMDATEQLYLRSLIVWDERSRMDGKDDKVDDDAQPARMYDP